MALISLRQLLDHAAENGYGVPAFNVNNLSRCAPSWKRPMKFTAR
jgi:fructose/tagatose bisphosphate aldolase